MVYSNFMGASNIAQVADDNNGFDWQNFMTQILKGRQQGGSSGRSNSNAPMGMPSLKGAFLGDEDARLSTMADMLMQSQKNVGRTPPSSPYPTAPVQQAEPMGPVRRQQGGVSPQVIGRLLAGGNPGLNNPGINNPRNRFNGVG